MTASKLIGGVVLSLVSVFAHAEQAHVAVAANFIGTAQKIATRFERETSHKITLVSGSTGKFHAQIRNGAPFDALLAADQLTPGKLEKEGLAVSGTSFTYAIGKLVLWSSQSSLVDDKGDVLATGAFTRIALANPKVAPYGAAAIDTLNALGLHDKLQAKMVFGENIAQAYQFVASGNAQLGFVALSQIFADGKYLPGSAWIVPARLHGTLRQDAVLLLPGRGNLAAVSFLAYLKSPVAQDLIRASGYDL